MRASKNMCVCVCVCVCVCIPLPNQELFAFLELKIMDLVDTKDECLSTVYLQNNKENTQNKLYK